MTAIPFSGKPQFYSLRCLTDLFEELALEGSRRKQVRIVVSTYKGRDNHAASFVVHLGWPVSVRTK